jgi:protein-S-isoprenylcysteine O-methyltransferase Ste14
MAAMNAQSSIAAAGLRHDPRPASAVSTGVGIAGVTGLLAWAAVARTYGFDGYEAAVVAMLSCAVPMVLWSIFVDKVHRSPTTGIDWSAPPRPFSETLDISLVKIAGLWGTWAGIAFLYCVCRWYWSGIYVFPMQLLGYCAVPLLFISVPYTIILDRRMAEPRDGSWHFGQLVVGRFRDADREAVYEHLRCWAIKAFFLAFMIAIVPGNWIDTVRPSAEEIASHPVNLARWLIAAMFMIDTTFATVGYALALKPLDSHIRSANPYAAGWMAALICYPPFILMNNGGPLDYHPGTADWTYWMDGYPLLLAATSFLLAALTAIYAWATIAFGPRFSNLTHRGILTHGPYAWTKHPAYVSKNIFWWIATLPFLATSGNPVDMVRNTVVLALVTGVYYWRAKTEERHLMADPAYREYAEWMERNGAIPRLFAKLRGRPAGRDSGPASELVPAE